MSSSIYLLSVLSQPDGILARVNTSLLTVSKHPALWLTLSVPFYLLARFSYGGSRFGPGGKAFVAIGHLHNLLFVVALVLGKMCVPISLGSETWFHILITLLYIQLNLLLGFSLGQIPLRACNLPLIYKRLIFKRHAFVSNGALVNEVWWQVIVSDGFRRLHYPVWLSILVVPVTSGFGHGVVSNGCFGFRVMPNFLSVALAYHLSGSIWPPVMIHSAWMKFPWAMWYNYPLNPQSYCDMPFVCGTVLVATYYGLIYWVCPMVPVQNACEDVGIAFAFCYLANAVNSLRPVIDTLQDAVRRFSGADLPILDDGLESQYNDHGDDFKAIYGDLLGSEYDRVMRPALLAKEHRQATGAQRHGMI